ncbi:MAG: hypothetical protein JM58_12770 [Peptococcaceae bacterium BICA1-8]|nr:MAG: hypothetical protein JM58_12770 [Peptococcaceae bacterium BICA1-8]
MGKIIGIISCNYLMKNPEGLTRDRPLAALPFGGRYRLLDFALSNMVNSGIRTVGMVTPYHYRPILDHIGAGKEWYLDRKTGGLFILPGATHGIYFKNNKFALRDITKNIEFLEKEKAEYVIISGCSNIFNIDYTNVLRNHEETKVDITLLYKELILNADEDPQGVILEIDAYGRVQKLESNQGKEGQGTKYFADVFILKRTFLLDIIKGHQNMENLDLLDILRENISQLKIGTYSIAGYFGRIYSKQTYFQRSMELLQPSVQNELFLGEHRVLTRIKDNPPTKYGPSNVIRDSLVSSGCIIKGCVSGSIIFRGVVVEAEASITNCIVLQKCVIKKGAMLENVIVDKYNIINPGTVIKGQEGDPLVIKKSRMV